MKITKISVTQFSSLKTAIYKMTQASCKTLLVTNNNILIGTISDGDIRKQLLSNNDLQTKVTKIFNRNPIFVYDYDFEKNTIAQIFLKNKIDLIPIVNGSKKIINTIKWHEAFSSEIIKYPKINLPVVIMAGGKGERLKPLTDVFPKPLIPVSGEPIIIKIIKDFSKYGIKNIYLSLNYKADIIKSFIKKIPLKPNISFILENKYLGTAGSLYKIKKYNYNNFILANCDILINLNISKFTNFHKKEKNDLTILVAKQIVNLPYGICLTNDDNTLIKIDEKPTYEYKINAGMYIINKSVLDYVKPNTYLDMDKLIEKLISNKLKIKIYEFDYNNWKEIGRMKDYIPFLYEN